MKNIFRKQSLVKPTGQDQKFEGTFSPTVITSGLGFGIVWLAKQSKLLTYEIANTESMVPTLDEGHILIAEPVTFQTKLKIGDICVYKFENSLIVHRITNILGNNFIFKGDNNYFSDWPVQKEQIVSRILVISYTR